MPLYDPEPDGTTLALFTRNNIRPWELDLLLYVDFVTLKAHLTTPIGG